MEKENNDPLEERLRHIFDSKSEEEARNEIGHLVMGSDGETSDKINLISSRIYEGMAKDSYERNIPEFKSHAINAIRCAVNSNNDERVYEILDDPNINDAIREYANRGIRIPTIEHPIDIIHDLAAMGNGEARVMHEILTKYFEARGIDLDSVQKTFNKQELDTFEYLR